MTAMTRATKQDCFRLATVKQTRYKNANIKTTILVSNLPYKMPPSRPHPRLLTPVINSKSYKTLPPESDTLPPPTHPTHLTPAPPSTMPSKISEKATHAFALVSLVYSVLVGVSLGTKKGWRLFTVTR